MSCRWTFFPYLDWKITKCDIFSFFVHICLCLWDPFSFEKEISPLFSCEASSTSRNLTHWLTHWLSNSYHSRHRRHFSMTVVDILGLVNTVDMVDDCGRHIRFGEHSRHGGHHGYGGHREHGGHRQNKYAEDFLYKSKIKFHKISEKKDDCCVHLHMNP